VSFELNIYKDNIRTYLEYKNMATKNPDTNTINIGGITFTADAIATSSDY